jgi:L-arabinose isomerase
MQSFDNAEVWFLTGSQYLYGQETLDQVAQHSQQIVDALNAASPAVRIVYQPILTNPQDILSVCRAANAAETCVGVITWMHTFSPARNWISGLMALQKPMLHLHTQFNRDIPWAEIDMDFMNLNQAAHGDREFGFLVSRMRRARKVVVGHWNDTDVQQQIDTWMRAACAWHDAQDARLVRFGDNMRSVAVTEGDKVEAQLQLGYQVYGHGVGNLVAVVNDVSEAEVNALVEVYETSYTLAPDLLAGGARRDSVREAARIELGIRRFLEAGRFTAFTTTFEDLHGLKQLPGLAVQRLMADGYGFAGEGDWKTAALVRAMKGMSRGLEGEHRLWRTTPITFTRTECRCWALTCWKSALVSPMASCVSKCIPSALGARQTHHVWSLTQRSPLPSTPHSWIWAIVSASPSTS